MLARANTSIYWPGIRKSIINHQSNCRTCLEISPSQAREPLVITPPPQRPFQNLCSDLFQLDGHHYLIVVDRFSGFLHIFHSKEPPTHKFLEISLREIFTRYGRPEQLDSDGGPQFKADGFRKFLETWGVRHRVSSPYYPQSNGRAEAAVKSAKRMLRDNVGRHGSINNDRVACAVLQYHNTPLQDGPMSPAQLIFGRALSDFLPNNPKAYQLHPYWADQVKRAQEARESHHKRLEKRYNFGTRNLKPLNVGQNVVIQDQVGSSRRWNRFGVIIESLPNRRYKIRLHDTGNTTFRNRRFIKPARMTIQQRGPYSGPITGPSVPPTSNYSINSRPPPVDVRATYQSSAPARSQLPQQHHAQSATRERTNHQSPNCTNASPPQHYHHDQAAEKIPLMLRRLKPFNRPGLQE